jgi:hypothetical protein
VDERPVPAGCFGTTGAADDTEDAMSTIERKRSGGLSMLDTVLVTAGVVGGVLVVLTLVAALSHLVVLVFKVVVLVVVIAVVVRLVHLLTRGRS